MPTAARYLDVLAEFAAGLDIEKSPAAFPTATPARVTVRPRDGGVRQAEVRHAHGDPARPLSATELDAKFRALAQAVLGADTEDAARAIRDLPATADVRSITARLRGPS